MYFQGATILLTGGDVCSSTAMAVELDFEWVADVANEEIARTTSETLVALLNLNVAPLVHVTGSMKDERWVRISVGDFAEVELLIYQVEEPRLISRACVSYGGSRTPASRVLCLAVTLSLAGRSNVPVIDDANLYGLGTGLDSDEVLKKLRLEGEPGSFECQVERMTIVTCGKRDNP